MVGKTAPKAKKNGKAAKGKAKPPPPKVVEEESSSEEESDEEMPAQEESSEEESSSEVAAPTGKAVAADDDDDEEDSDDDEDDSDEEEEPAQKVVAPTKKAPAPKKAAPKKAAPVAEEEDSDDDEDEEEDSDEEDDSEEEEEEVKPKAKGKAKGKAVEKMEEEDDDDEDDDEDDDDDDEEDEEDSDEEEEEEVVNEQNKRAKKQKEKPAKKAKVENGSDDAAEGVTLFVGNLSAETTAEDVEKFFKKAGVAVSEVRRMPRKKFGYVDLASPDDLDAAVALNGKALKDEPIKIEKSTRGPTPKKEWPSSTEKVAAAKDRQAGRAAEDECTLFVKHLPEGCDTDTLKEAFPKAVNVRIPLQDDKPRGFGFLVFGSPEEAESMLTECQGMDLNGSALLLDHAGSKSTFKSPARTPRGGGSFGGGRGSSGRGTSKTLFVKNLSYETGDSDLKEAFDGCASARVVTDRETQQSKGFGFVDFNSPEAAAEAFDAMKDQEVGGRKLFLDFSEARSPGGGGGFGRGGRGGGGRGGGFRGGRGGGFGGGRGGGFRGGRGGGGFRGGRGGGGRGGFGGKRDGIKDFAGKKKTFE